MRCSARPRLDDYTSGHSLTNGRPSFLRAHKKARHATATKGRGHQGDSFGTPPDDRNLNQHVLRPAAKQLGLYWEGFGFHTFRRMNVSWRQDRGHRFRLNLFDYHEMRGGPDRTRIRDLYRVKVAVEIQPIDLTGCFRGFRGLRTGAERLSQREFLLDTTILLLGLRSPGTIA